MFSLCRILALASLACALSSGVGADVSETMQVFFDDMDDRIEDYHKANKGVLVLFMAPWCDNCKNFQPEFQKAANILDNMMDEGLIPGKVVLGDIDVTVFTDVGKKYNVEAFPTLKYFPPGGEPKGFDAAMDSEGVVNFIVRNTVPPVTKLADKAALKAFLELQAKLPARKVMLLMAAKESAVNEKISEGLELMAKDDTTGARFGNYVSETPGKDVQSALDELGIEATIEHEEVIVGLRSRDGGVEVKALGEDTGGQEDMDAETYGEVFEDFLGVVGEFPSHVTELTGANFDQVLNDNTYVLVEFMAPWCGFCQKLEPIYESLAANVVNEYNGTGTDIVIAKVDATEEEALAKKYDVEGFPTLKWFRNGKAYGFSDEREDVYEMLDWIRRKTSPSYTPLTDNSEATIEKFLASSPVALVVFAPGEPSAELDECLYGIDRPTGLVKGASADVLKKYTGGKTLAIYIRSDAGSEVIDPDTVSFSDPETLRKAIMANSMPLVSPFTDDFLDAAISAAPTYIVFLISPKGDDTVSALKEVAKSIPRSLAAFSHIDVMDGEMDYALDFFLLDHKAGTEGRFIRATHTKEIDSGGGVYAFSNAAKQEDIKASDISLESMQAFLKKIGSKELAPVPEPEEGDEEEAEEKDEL